MRKIINWSLVGISIVSLLLWFGISGTEVGEDESYSDIMLVISYVLFIFVLAAVLFFLVTNLLRHPKLLKKTLIMGSISLIVTLLCYAMTSNEPVEGVSASSVAYVETGLYLFYILTVLAIGLMIFFGIRKFLNR